MRKKTNEREKLTAKAVGRKFATDLENPISGVSRILLRGSWKRDQERLILVRI
jgi:hypothetical protein